MYFLYYNIVFSLRRSLLSMKTTATFGGQAERVKLTDLPITFLPLPATTPTTSLYQDVSHLLQTSLTAAASSGASDSSDGGGGLTQTVKGLAGIVQQTVHDHNRLSG